MARGAAAESNIVEHPSRSQNDEGVIHMEAVKESIEELEKLFTRAKSAKEALREAVTKVAEKSGLRPDVLSAYVKARCNDRLDEYQTKAEQLSLVFSEVE